MEWLNYNQLQYFWVIAELGSVTKAAEKLRLSQSNLSAQLGFLEESLGQPLFVREGRRLLLSESGKIVFAYAQGIFRSGQEMLDVLKGRPTPQSRRVIRIGAISSLSKNLQFEFIRPLLAQSRLKLVVVEGGFADLTRQLQDHRLDVVISNVPARSQSEPELYNHRLGSIPVYAVGSPRFRSLTRGFPRSLASVPLFVPGSSATFKSDWDAWLQRMDVIPEVRAEIEDMALLRILALSGEGVAIVPEIVVRKELKDRTLSCIKKLDSISEAFYAVTATRKFPNREIEEVVRKFAERAVKPWN